jgi:hypothetical protein
MGILKAQERSRGIVDIVAADSRGDVVMAQCPGFRCDCTKLNARDDGRAAGFVLDYMAFFAQYHFASPRAMGKNGELITERTTGYEDSGLLSGQIGGQGFQLVDRGIVAIHVISYMGGSHGPTHSLGWPSDSIATKVNEIHFLPPDSKAVFSH